MWLQEVAVAATEKSLSASTTRAPAAPLASLTLAAMALPGLMMQPVCAEESDSISFLHEHYEESSRDLAGMSSKFQPIQVDTILGEMNFTLTDDLKGVISITQDTWSGATPVATAPLSAHGNRVTAGHTHVMTGASMDESGHIHDEENGEAPVTQAAEATTGASPYLYSSLKMNAQHRPLNTDKDGKVVGGVDNQLVHTLSSASPEVRQQFDLDLSRTWNQATLHLGGGVSTERDFTSVFGHTSGNWDFNQKLTTLGAGISYAHSTTDALLDHDAVPHVYEPYMLTYERKGDDTYNRTHSTSSLEAGEHAPRLKGNRDDWGVNLSITQILNQSAYVEANLGFTHSFGYQSNPYKAVEVAFIDPLKQTGQAGGNTLANYVYDAELVALMEQRPDLRNQGTLGLNYVQHIEATDAALHLGYRYFQDNWGIQAHSLEAQWVQPVGETWTLTPRLRYYSQSKADFYTPYMVTEQGLYSNVTDAVKGSIYIDTRDTRKSVRYFEDPTGSIAAPIDNNPASRKYGQPVVGAHGRAIIDQDTGLAVNDQLLVDALKQDTVPFDRSKLPAHYSSDPRLSGYGTLAAGIVVTKTIKQGVNVEFSYEQMRHAGGLKLNGGGEGAYADFDSYLVNLALNIDLAQSRDPLTRRNGPSEQSHASHHAHTTSMAPAGVQFDHLLEHSGEMMVGYRLMYLWQGGEINQHGTTSDYELVNKGCQGHPCYVRPTDMTMRMHMLDFMYAPTDWLTLMFMPQFVDMNMDMRLLDESPRTGGMDAIGMAIMHAEHTHTSSGLGDTELHGLFSLMKLDNAELHMGVGLSAPTADVDLSMRPMMGNDTGFMEYGMQLGSGTWDLKPSLTLTGRNEQLAWGVQLSATKRLEAHNASGYALGDAVQSTLWGSYSLSQEISASLRGLYSEQEPLTGAYNNTHVPIGPGDYSQNYGGRFVDAGVGLSANISTGAFAGTRLSIEWLQPVADKPEGYQLERRGSLVLNWGLHL